MKRRLYAMIALLLALCMLAGCTSGFGDLAETISGGIAEAIGGKSGDGDQVHNPDGLKFSEMNYYRPDFDKLSSDVGAVTEALDSGEDIDRVIELLEVCMDDYYEFSTMYSLANIYNCKDLRDEYYADEYSWCSEHGSLVSQLFDEMYYACAGSSLGPELEEEYFWEGFCEDYADPNDSYYNDVTVALMQEESELISRYREMMADPTITYNGKERSVHELLDELSGYNYLNALKAYYEKYNEPLAEIYIELMRVRTDMATEMGFSSCEEMEFSFTFDRDYTPEDAARFVQGVKTYIVPLYIQADKDGLSYNVSYSKLNSDDLYLNLKGIMTDIGGDCLDAFEFMSEYELYDIEPNPYKANSSFQTYLDMYEAPFIFVNPNGNTGDLLTFVHEFGHYTDAYVNFDAAETIDLAECYSQGLEFLSLSHMGNVLSDKKVDELRFAKTLDAMDTFIQQASFADFESKAHAIGPDGLSAQKLNELSLQAAKDFGYCPAGFEEYMQYVWMDITHFFEYPFYVISYPVSLEIAMQIYALELEEEGKGLEKYFEMLPRDYDTFMETVLGNGLDSPFDESSLAATADVIRRELGYDENLRRSAA